MSVLDKVIAAVTLRERDQDQERAQQNSKDLTSSGLWLAQVLAHRRQIEALFAAAKMATSADPRRATQKRLALDLNSPSIAGEASVSAAFKADKKIGQAGRAYQEGSAAEMAIRLLELLDLVSHNYLDKLEHTEKAVAHPFLADREDMVCGIGRIYEFNRQGACRLSATRGIRAEYWWRFERYGVIAAGAQ